MDNGVTEINERVTVVAIYERRSETARLCYPAKMRYRDQEVTFTEFGLWHPTKQGKRAIHVFDMSDGVCDYRLEFDAEALTWRLISILDLSGGRHGE
jgi:hypothetical protein